MRLIDEIQFKESLLCVTTLPPGLTQILVSEKKKGISKISKLPTVKFCRLDFHQKKKKERSNNIVN